MRDIIYIMVRVKYRYILVEVVGTGEIELDRVGLEGELKAKVEENYGEIGVERCGHWLRVMYVSNGSRVGIIRVG